VLTPKEYSAFTLIRRTHHTHDTDMFEFALSEENALLNLPVSSCLMVRVQDRLGNDVARPYTPIFQDLPGRVTLLIKNYDKGVISKYIHSLREGDKCDMKGPFPKLAYKPNMKKHIIFIAGGTGITPCMQVMDAIAFNKDDQTKVGVIFANHSFDDILLKNELDALVSTRPDQFRVAHILDRADHKIPDFGGRRIDEDLLTQLLPEPNKDTLVYVCGPPKFMEDISGNKTKDMKQGEVTGILKKLGWDSDNVYKF